jgi:hypothetical protein
MEEFGTPKGGDAGRLALKLPDMTFGKRRRICESEVPTITNHDRHAGNEIKVDSHILMCETVKIQSRRFNSDYATCIL